MDNQSRSFDETAGHVGGYYTRPLAMNQDATLAPYESYAGYANEYFDQFADPNHQSYAGSDLGYLGNSTFSPGASYSPELDLCAEFPNFTLSAPEPQDQHVYPVLDPAIALQQIEDGLGRQPTSPWDPVAQGSTSLTPYYHPSPSTTHRTLASRATRSQADDITRSTTRTSSGWDNVSSRSGNTDSSGVTTCGRCGKIFGDLRQARRHATEVHREDNDPQYICKCSYQVTRKSNYLRHLSGSCKGRISANDGYVCICKKSFADLDAHLAHIRVCGKKKAGRPPNSSRSSHA